MRVRGGRRRGTSERQVRETSSGPTAGRTRASRANLWALVGAVWGLVSMFPVVAPHLYFTELMGSRAASQIARPMLWLAPSWYVVLVAQWTGLDSSGVPIGIFIGAVAIASMTLGAGVALAIRWATVRLSRDTDSPGHDGSHTADAL